MTTAIIVAAGKSERMGTGTDKAFLSLGNKPVVAWSLLAFERSQEIDRIILVVRKGQQIAAKAVAQMFGISKLQAIVPGGARRQESVQAGLAAADTDTRYVVIHDGARPCVDSGVIGEIAKLVKRMPAVTVGRRITDTVKRVERGSTVSKTEDRDKLWCVQTPQAFQIKTLRAALNALGKDETITDECQAVEKLGEPVKIYESRSPNFKITTVEDLQIANALLVK